MSTRILRIMALLLVAAIWPSAWADVPTYNMPGTDGIKEAVTVDEELLFYDKGGPEGSLSSTWYKTACIFKNADEGQPMTINFSMVDVNGAALYIYDTAYTDTSSLGYSGKTPADGYIAMLTGQLADQEFTSDSGVISVVYYATTSGCSGAGWEAHISCVPATDMTWGSTTLNTGYSLPLYPGATDVPLLCVDAFTEGGANPFSVTEATFGLTGTALSSLKNVRLLYNRSAVSPAGGTQIGDAYADAAATLTFTGEQALKGKHNYLWLVADVPANATAGTSFTASATSLMAGGEQRIASELTGESTDIKNMVFMPTGPATFQVGEAATMFYDDGGPDANISKGFSGVVTFAPTHEARKVKITFESLALFNNASAVSVGNQDVLRIYNGSAAEDAALLADVTTPISISSTAADGSLTVTFKSVTQSYTTAGWVAKVEEFEPQPMAATSIVATAVEGTKTQAGTPGEVLNFSIPVSGTEPALTLSGVKASVTGSTATVDKVAVADAKGNILGEAAPQGDVATIAFASPVTLAQLGNDFSLLVTPASTAESAQTIKASIAEVTLSSGVMTPAVATEGTLTIDNVIELLRDTHEYTIYGEWTLINQPSETSIYLNYDGAAGDRIAVIKPGTEGMVVELDFEKFKINWPSYGYAPTFKVYAGTSATGTPLWECTKTLAATGPDAVIRSTAADGALTIVFNPNGNNGSSSDGFKAALREYKSMPMAVSKVEVTQASTASLKSGDTDAPVLRMAVTTTGDQQPLSFDALDVELKHVAASVLKVKLYTTGKTDTFDAATATLLNEVGPADDDTSVSLVPAAYTLPEKTSYYWVVFDMKETIEAGHDMDAAVTAFRVGGSPVQGILTPDPEGVRPSVNVHYYQGGGEVVEVKGNLLFYDDGGPDAIYTSNHKGLTTFKPQEGEIICFEFQDFYINTRDDFSVYSGTDNTGFKHITLSGEKRGDSAPADIYSTSEDGCLTVDFTGEKPYNDGWAIIVRSLPREQFNIKAVEVTPIEGATLLRGAKNAPVARIKVTVGGTVGPVPLTAFSFTDGSTAGTLTGLSLTASDTYDSYDAITEIAAGEEMTLAVSDYSLETPGVKYFWLRADVAQDAPADAIVELSLASINGTDGAMWSTASDEVTYTLASGLIGTYTIGTSEDADYPNISAAAQALKRGVEGPVVFLVESGEYKELVTIPVIPGTSEEHTVTFRSASGNRDDVRIYHDRYSHSYGEPEYGAVTVDGAEWLVFESLTFEATDDTYPAVVRVQGAARHFTMRDCLVKATEGNYNYPTLVEFRNNTDRIPNTNNDYSLFESNLFQGGYMGIDLGGTGIVNPVMMPRQKGGIVRGNSFVGQGGKGLYINAEADVQVLSNYFESTQSAGTSYYCIDSYNADGNTVIDGNIFVHNFSQSSSSAIFVRPNVVADNACMTITNNEIVMRNATGSPAGITYSTPYPTERIANNSIFIEGGTSSSRCIFVNDVAEGLDIYNNVLVNNAQGYAIYINRDTYKPHAIGYNLLSSDEPDHLAYFAGVVADIEAWAEAIGDETSFTAPIEFLAPEVLEPKDFTGLDKALALDYVTTDIAGTARPAENITVGAYEASDVTSAPALAEGYPAVDNVAHDSARICLQADCHGTARIITLPAAEAAPAAEDFEAEEVLTLSLRKGRQGSARIEGLEPNTEYVAYVLLSSLRGVDAEPVASPLFTTSYLPTAVSTFENVTPDADNEADFTDGTAHFSGFIVADGSDLPVAGTKEAVMEDTEATVMLTNASNLTLDGFWLRNEQVLTITAITDPETDTPATKTLQPAGWHYVNLRDMGELAGLKFYTEGAAAIDDFSGEPAALSAQIDAETTSVQAGDTFTLAALVAGGVEPFTYSWLDAAHNLLGTEAELSTSATHSGIYRLDVEDAWGNKASANLRINVAGDMVIGSFEDLYLEENSNWHGPLDATEDIESTFLTGSFELANYYMPSWLSWSRFGYANIEGTHFSSYLDDMVCAAGSGHNSSNYGVGFLSNYNGGYTTISFTNTGNAQAVPGLWITNTEWLKESVYDGDGMSDEFKSGDYCEVQITGVKADGSLTDPVVVRLADFTSSDEADWYCLDTWQWFSLAELGEVTALRWSFDSTKRNSNGITTPAYVCIDDLGDSCPVKEAEAVTVPDDERAVPLADFFTFDPADGNIAYTLVSGEATIVGDNAVITAAMHSTTDLVVCATQRGQREWVKIPVDVTAAGIGAIDASLIIGIDIYSTDGMQLHSGASMPRLAPGIYIVVRHTAQGAYTSVERR